MIRELAKTETRNEQLTFTQWAQLGVYRDSSRVLQTFFLHC